MLAQRGGVNCTCMPLKSVLGVERSRATRAEGEAIGKMTNGWDRCTAAIRVAWAKGCNGSRAAGIGRIALP